MNLKAYARTLEILADLLDEGHNVSVERARNIYLEYKWWESQRFDPRPNKNHSFSFVRWADQYRQAATMLVTMDELLKAEQNLKAEQLSRVISDVLHFTYRKAHQEAVRLEAMRRVDANSA